MGEGLGRTGRAWPSERCGGKHVDDLTSSKVILDSPSKQMGAPISRFEGKSPSRVNTFAALYCAGPIPAPDTGHA